MNSHRLIRLSSSKRSLAFAAAAGVGLSLTLGAAVPTQFPTAAAPTSQQVELDPRPIPTPLPTPCRTPVGDLERPLWCERVPGPIVDPVPEDLGKAAVQAVKSRNDDGTGGGFTDDDRDPLKDKENTSTEILA
ncbi:hypothetical protein [Micrococcoides hystricis]|uniref:Uncharacterized protein n=1 Tax=Micrococcoides hystricis TaxID=1572761 RepID=A0ABV6P9G2_9MICC